MEEANAGGQAASGIVQALAFDGTSGTTAVLHRPDQAGAGLLFTLRTAKLDLY